MKFLRAALRLAISARRWDFVLALAALPLSFFVTGGWLLALAASGFAFGRICLDAAGRTAPARPGLFWALAVGAVLLRGALSFVSGLVFVIAGLGAALSDSYQTQPPGALMLGLALAAVLLPLPAMLAALFGVRARLRAAIGLSANGGRPGLAAWSVVVALALAEAALVAAWIQFGAVAFPALVLLAPLELLAWSAIAVAVARETG